MPRTAVAYLRPHGELDLELGPPRKLTIVATYVDQADDDRPALAAALESIASGPADTLYVQRLGAVAASLGELVRLIDWLADADATLLAGDVALDTRGGGGARSVALLREIERWSREPADRRRPPGRPGLATGSPALAERIGALRESGLSLLAIAERLNADRVPTPRGGAMWRPSSVQAALGYRRPRPPAPGVPPPRKPKHKGKAPLRPGSGSQAAPSTGPEARTPSALTGLIQSLGPLGVFLLMVPESACVPVPSEVTLLFSGFAVSQHWMSLPLAVLAATAGNLAGSLIAYGIGASRLLTKVPGGEAVLAPQRASA